MFLIYLTFIAAFSVELLGTYVSIVGLSGFLGQDYIIMGLAIALDIGKLVIVTMLYKYWKHLPVLMRAYMLPAAVVTMMITSVGAFGYLSAAFQSAIMPTKQSNIQVVALTQERDRLQTRKDSIDKQIEQLPSTSISGRTRLIKQFKDEQDIITKRLFEIDKTLPEIQTANANVEAHAGPVLYVAKVFDIPVEEAVKYVIFLIIFVFDPLAVTLVLCGNFLVEFRQRQKYEQPSIPQAPPVVEETFFDPIIEAPASVIEVPIVKKPKRVRKKKEPVAEIVPAIQSTDEISIVEPIAQPEPEVVIEQKVEEPVTYTPAEPVEILDEPKPHIKNDRSLESLFKDDVTFDDVFNATGLAEQDNKPTEQPEEVVSESIESVETSKSNDDFKSSLHTQRDLPGSEIMFEASHAKALKHY